MPPDLGAEPNGVATHAPETLAVAHRVLQQVFMARMPAPTLDDDGGSAYPALERLVTASMQISSFLYGLRDDIPEGADAVLAFRESFNKWFGQELIQFLACCTELGYDTTPPPDDE